MSKLDFIGNERVIEQLGALLSSKHFPHALIIEGDDGLGKKTLARQLASALVCRGDEPPCKECSQCRKAMSGIHPDIAEYGSTGAANSFHVDVIRDIINDAYMKPNEAAYKVYILSGADSMSAAAQNALLKILEEPPSYIVFILTARAKSMLLDTVLSRSVVVSLEGVDINDGAKYIADSNDDIDFNSARLVLETFNGNIGKALASFKDDRVKELTQACCTMCKALVDGREYDVLCECAKLQKDRQAVVFATDFMKNIFRDAMVYNADADNNISGQKEIAKLLHNRLSRKKLIDLIVLCDKLKEMALMNSNNSVLITKLCYSLMQAVGK